MKWKELIVLYVTVNINTNFWTGSGCEETSFMARRDERHRCRDQVLGCEQAPWRKCLAQSC